MIENKYYVYVYLDPRKIGKFVYGEYSFDHEPFYVGRGCGNRDRQHVLELGQRSQQNKNRLKQNKLRKIIEEGFDPIVIRLIDHISFDESSNLEIYVIERIGRLVCQDGPLTNIERGGTGKKDYIVSKETRNKISLSCKGKTLTDATKELIRKSKIGFRHSIETKEKIRIAKIGSHPNRRDSIVISKYRKNYYIITNDKNSDIAIITSGYEMNKYCKENSLDYNKLKNSLYDIPHGKKRRIQTMPFYIERIKIEKS